MENASRNNTWSCFKNVKFQKTSELSLPQVNDNKIQPVPWISKIGELVKAKSFGDDLYNHLHRVEASKKISVRYRLSVVRIIQ